MNDMVPADREELAALFTGEGVELGVASGSYSSLILEKSRCIRLWSIDRWSDHHDSTEYIKAARKLAERGKGRCIPLRLTFSEALPSFRDGSLNFVYVDGYAHAGQEGGQTLENWWPKLKAGGIFAGHDYHPRWKPTMDAVNAFVARHGLTLNVASAGKDPFPSWWVRKPPHLKVAPCTATASSAPDLAANLPLQAQPDPADSAHREHLKHEGIYSHPSSRAIYARACNHGAKALPLLQKWKCKSIVDVGCGLNEFAESARKAMPGIKVIGVDFACPAADVIACATRLPFADKAFEVVTAFGMLEHVLPEQVDQVLSEFARVARKFVFSIADKPGMLTWRGEDLHPTVESEEWWMNRIMSVGGTHLAKDGRYLTGRWENLKMPRRASCVLVGNGPSVLMSQRGPAIDSFDEVVRFNAYALRGFEKHTGLKTTLWSTFGRGMLPADADERPQRILYVHGESGGPAYTPDELYRIPRSFFNKMRTEVQGRTKSKNEDRDRLLPSSGLLVASWLLDVVGLPKIHATGFDHFQKERSGQHHYWIPAAFGRPREHDGVAEATIFAEWRDAGLLEYL